MEGIMIGKPMTLCAVVLFFFGSVVAVHGQGEPAPCSTGPGLENCADASSGEDLTFSLGAEQPVEVPPHPWVGRVLVVPGPAFVEKAGVPGLPTFTRTVVARGKTYRYTMVGSDPFVRNARPVVVPVVLIPVRFEFDDGTVFDPTVLGLACAGGDTPLNLALQSPVFQNADYGDGSRQYEEEMRRVEFWALTGATGALNPGYSVRVSASVFPTLRVVTSGFPTERAFCGRVGIIDINSWDKLVRTTIFPQLRRLGVSARTFPLFLFSDVVLFNGDPKKCCALGYHSWFNSGGAQTYGVADYDLSGAFPALEDVAILSHELGEWYDDPFGNNPTPPWGHIGQVSGCQANLEVGDPLTGLSLQVSMPNGVTYHPQELAFFSWFFAQVPSLGFDGWYSSLGTFRAPAALCR
jgi:hypothetical protein